MKEAEDTIAEGLQALHNLKVRMGPRWFLGEHKLVLS